jgi:hypothetical protein
MSKSPKGAGKTSRKQTSQQKYNFLWRLMADETLSPAAKVVGAALLLKFHNLKTGRCNPSYAAIGASVGRRRRIIFQTVAELRNTGWLAVQSTKGGSPGNTSQFDFDFERVQSTTPLPVQDTTPVLDNAPVQYNAQGVLDTAHEPLRTTAPFGRGGEGGENPARRAPSARREEFAELCRLWQRPYGLNEAKAQAAFDRLVGDGVASADIIASARSWVAAREPAFLPALERWLNDGAWRNDPPARRTSNRKESAVEVAVRLAREGGSW